MSDVAAQKAINYLKEKRLGKATFYPLNLLEARPLPASDKELLKAPGVLGLLAEFLEFNITDKEQLRSLDVLANYLGGRTFVTDNLDNARALARKCHSRYRIVTTTGEVIWTGGTMSGGEDKEERVGLLKRQALTRNLRKEIEKDSKTLMIEEAALKEFTKAVDLKKAELSNLQAQLKEDRFSLDSLKNSYGPLANNIDTVQAQLNAILKEKERLENNILECKRQLDLIGEEIDELEKDQEKQRENLKILANKEWTKEPELRQSYQRLKEQETIKKERVASLQSQKIELFKAKEEIEKGIEEGYRELDKLLLYQVKERLNALNKSKLRMVLLFTTEANRDLLEERRVKKAELLSVIDAVEEEIKALRPQIVDAEAKLRDITAEYAKLEGQIENAKEKAEELDISLTKTTCDLEISKEEKAILQQVVRKLEREISHLGIVNIGAIEEYNEVYERYSFLTTQISDLSSAKLDLLEVLAKLDKKSREKFSEAFFEIKAEFEQLFQNLFGGGKATLLLEEGDILEAGIEIKAQPPGKKLQSIALLSGGEKTLTAIALVFAVISVKKVPYYLFDEVDAPLDEANLLRLLALIAQKAEDSQIILITHRRRSMEEASLLYGVTMEEKGVSKILALRLEDENAAATFEE